MNNRITPRAFFARLFVVVWCVLCGAAIAPAALAADGDDGIDLQISPDEAYAQRFLWLHWWETQRANYQRESNIEQYAQWSEQRAAAVEPYREQIIQALKPMVKDTAADPYARAGAIIALARLGDEELLKLIVSDAAPAEGAQPRLGPSGQSWPAGLVGDESVRVRVAGWLALGILDTQESRARLTDEFVWAVTINDEIARVTAFGFLKELSSSDREFLIRTMRNSKIAEVQRMALWSLDQHDTPDNDPIMRDAIRQLISPYSVAQAIQSVGSMKRLKSQQLLAMMIARPDEINEITVLNNIRNGTVWQSTCTFGVKEELTISALLTLTKLDPIAGENGRMLRKALVKKVEEGPPQPDVRDGSSTRPNADPIYNYDRGPSALALAMQADASSGLSLQITTLSRVFDDGLTKTHVLVEVKDPTDKSGKTTTEVWDYRELTQRDNPARGYAGIAMGLMLARMNPQTETGKAHPLNLRSKSEYANIHGDLSRPLMKILANKSDLVEVRSAAAIAMGISGFEEFRKPLHEAIKELDAGDAALYGYIVEALAMLDDPQVPELVEKYMLEAKASTGDNDLLARRALASAMIFSKHTKPEDADRVLTKAWSHSPWAGLAMAKASAMRGGGEMIGYLIEQLGDEQSRAAAAISLGDVVDTRSAYTMSRLTDDMNYTLDYRTPVQLTWNPYKPGDQEPLPTRLVTGFDDPLFVHVMLFTRLPPATQGGTTSNGVTLVNDDSDGPASFFFRPAPPMPPAPSRAGR